MNKRFSIKIEIKEYFVVACLLICSFSYMLAWHAGTVKIKALELKLQQVTAERDALIGVYREKNDCTWVYEGERVKM